MKYNLSDEDRAVLDRRIAEVEKLTGAQIVLATTKRSDSYAEIPWKAFSLGASVSGLLVFLLGLVLPVWVTNTAILMTVAGVLAPGILLAVLSVLCRRVGRFFLSKNRKETETLQYAKSLFLSKELFATRQRKAILLLISEFEKHVVILPDTAIRKMISPEDLGKINVSMTELLKRKEFRKAFEAGLDGILLSSAVQGTTDSGSNELSDEIIMEDSI